MHLFVLIVIEINLLCICVEFIFNSISVNSFHSSSSILWHEASLIQIQTHELKEASSEFCPTLLSIVLFCFFPSTSHSPSQFLSLSPPKRQQDSPAKTASLNMPITYTFVICCCNWQAHAHAFACHYRTKGILAPYATHAWTMKAHTNRGDHTDTHTSAESVVPAPLTPSVCVKRSFVPQEQSLKYSYTSTTSCWIVGAAHTWSSARGSQSSPKRKMGYLLPVGPLVRERDASWYSL